MPFHKVKYRTEWEKDFSWLSPSTACKHQAHCKICGKDFRIDNSGICQVKQHSTKAIHVEKAKIQCGTSSQMTFSTQDDQKLLTLNPRKLIVLTPKQKVVNAEVIQALHVVESNQSFNQSADDSDRFRRQFPDSKIAETYSQGASKVKYVIEHGIAPYLHDQLKKDFEGTAFTFKYDETTTIQVKKQFDGYVQYWSNNENGVVTAYIGSIFVGHCTAEESLQHFEEFGKMMKWNTDLLLHLGHDGPRVNLAFEKKLEENMGSEILKLGTCNLHHIHNAFRAGLKELKDFDIDSFVNDVSFFFKYSAARREDYKLSEEITNIEARMSVRHTSTRWVTLKRACLRLLEQWQNLHEYFVNFLPRQSNFKHHIQCTERYKRIRSMLESDIYKVYLSFVAFTAHTFEEFLIRFQSNHSKICDLYLAIGSLLFKLMSRFIKKDVLHDVKSNDSLDAKSLSQIDCKINSSRMKLKKMDIGTRAKALLLDANVDEGAVKAFREECQKFYITAVTYLQTHLPVGNSTLRDLQYLLYQKRRESQSLSAISRLALNIGNVLGKQIHRYFNVNPEMTLTDICDTVRTQWICYQSDDIPEEWAVMETPKPTNNTDSYWNKVETEWITEDANTTDGTTIVPIDQYWSKVGAMKENGNVKYPQLFALVKCCLSISHGNSDPERGFSINKHILDAHGTSLSESCLMAIRRVKDNIIRCKGASNISITRDLLRYVENSHLAYTSYMAESKKIKLPNTGTKSQVENDSKRKRKAEIDAIELEIKSIKEGIEAAQALIKEGNEDLQAALKTLLIDRKKIVTAQTKIQLGIDRELQLKSKLNLLQERKDNPEKFEKTD